MGLRVSGSRVWGFVVSGLGSGVLGLRNKPSCPKKSNTMMLAHASLVWGLGLAVWGLGVGFWVWGLGFGVLGLGCRVKGFGFRAWGLGFGVWGLGFGV